MLMLKSTHDQIVRQLRYELISANMEIVRLRLVGMRRDKPETPSQFSDEQLRRLLQLCHPDKHSGSKASLEATQMLNNLRDRNKGR